MMRSVALRNLKFFWALPLNVWIQYVYWMTYVYCDIVFFSVLKLVTPAVKMAVHGTTPKRKEIYKYEAPWPLYSMNWSVRPDKRYRYVSNKKPFHFPWSILHSVSPQVLINFYFFPDLLSVVLLKNITTRYRLFLSMRTPLILVLKALLITLILPPKLCGFLTV